MTIQEIADRLVKLNRAGDHEEVYAELYDVDITSVENWSGERTEYHGMDALRKKSETWQASLVEMHDTRTSDPLIADKSFAVTFFIDATYKEQGRVAMTELAVYRVNENGKIYYEEFFN